MRITLDVPDDLASVLAPDGQDPARAALEAIGLEAYRQRPISGCQLRTPQRRNARMIVVARRPDPLSDCNRAVDVLQLLYDIVPVPQTVANELQQASGPGKVQSWISNPPHWFETRPDPPVDTNLEFLDPGERAAIALALSIGADRLLIADWEGRVEALLSIRGTRRSRPSTTFPLSPTW